MINTGHATILLNAYAGHRPHELVIIAENNTRRFAVSDQQEANRICTKYNVALINQKENTK